MNKERKEILDRLRLKIQGGVLDQNASTLLSPQEILALLDEIEELKSRLHSASLGFPVYP